jgi:quinol monooxygenase YgiN
MKVTLFNICALTLGLITSTYASETTMKINAKTIHKATYINMVSKQDSKSTFEQFLKEGALLVQKTEPNTALWFALKDDAIFAIFDIFFNEKGREQHFAGEVANALKDNASHLVQGGWEQGVLHNINNYDLVSSNDFNKDKVITAKEASYIVFKAKPGKNHELELLLKEGAQLINLTEPETYFWVALKMDKDTYAIFDAFNNQAAQKAHFSGKVASVLQKNAENLIVGGWEKGVLPNVHNFKIIAVS